jgi:hypothetical protein
MVEAAEEHGISAGYAGLPNDLGNLGLIRDDGVATGTDGTAGRP